MQTITFEALSAASLASQLATIDHETRATIRAIENGVEWAVLDVSPMTDTRRAVFPSYRSGMRGDTSKRGQSGVMLNSMSAPDTAHALAVVIQRAARMHSEKV